MTLKRKAAGSWTDITTTLKRRASGAWSQIAAIKRRSSGAWTTVWSAAAITDQSVSRSSTINTTATYTVKSDGTIAKTEGVTTTVLETWLVLGAAGNFEARATLSSGDTPSGTLGSWLALSSDRSWQLTAGPGDSFECDLLVEIRVASSGAVADAATITITSVNTA